MGGQDWPFVGREGDVDDLVSHLLRPQRPATLLLRGAAGLQLAQQAIESGAAKAKLDALVAFGTAATAGAA